MRRGSVHRRQEDTVFSSGWFLVRLECECKRRGTYHLKKEGTRPDASPYIGLMLTNYEVSHMMTPKGVPACQE